MRPLRSASKRWTSPAGTVAGRLLALLLALTLGWAAVSQSIPPCQCGFQDGLPTIGVNINIDGDMSQWYTAVIPDTDNNVCDNIGNQDRDRPIQSTGRDLRSFTFTWNNSYLFAYTTREASENNRIYFIYYADLSNDGIMQSGEPVIVARWQGNNQVVNMVLGDYVAVNAGGDSLTDGNGLADGYNMPGTIENERTFANMTGLGHPNGTEMEWRVPWNRLGIDPGDAIGWHIASSNNNPFSQSIGAQADDNMGGCGGGAGTSQFAALTFSPNNTNDVRFGEISYQSHTITNFGKGTDTFNLFSVTTGGWSPNSIQYYGDAGTIGVYEPGTDVLLTDTDSDGSSLPDTGPLISEGVTNILICYQVPGSGGGTATIETTATSAFEPMIGESVFDVLTIVMELSGHVYLDANRNNAKDGAEAGTGLTLYAKVMPAASPGGPATEAVAVNSTTGAYQFLLEAGSYRVVIDDNPNLADVTPNIPSGWFGTEEPDWIREVNLVASDQPNKNFGVIQGARLAGQVFRDTGTGGGTANDGLLNGGETGLANAEVTISGGAFTTTFTTDNAGAFDVFVALSSATAFTVVEANPPGFVSTGGSAGTTGGSYDRSTDTVSFTLTPGDVHTGILFGDVPDNIFIADNTATAQPGSTVAYPHVFLAGSAGSVSFSFSEVQSPANSLWSNLIYRDTNCNGQVDVGEPVILGAIALAEGEQLCILLRQFVPADAPFNAQNKVTITADFTYTDSSPLLVRQYSVNDLTIVGETSTASLTLHKEVDRATAKPGDPINYTITYTHNGTDPLADIVIQDYTPTFTTFVSAAAGALPSGLTGVSITSPGVGAVGALKWTLAGALQPGGSGSVTFTVQVDQ
jgi:uncharacterized repeat protein (TIGR01451 family)